MLIKLNYFDANDDFNWVIRILNSVQTENQLEVVSKCFQLWEKKHIDKKITEEEKSFINSLRSEYWALFKNKEIRLVRPFNV